MISKRYAGGEKAWEQKGDIRIIYYKDGTLRAKGKWIRNVMEGKWLFYRQTGQLWQIGYFKHNKKHGKWVSYDRKDKVEKKQVFEEGKLVRK